MADEPKGRVSFELESHSVPFRDDPPYAPAFYEAIGRVVVLWGKFEYLLDAHLQMVLNIAADHGFERDMQTSLKRKTERLREVYKACHVFQPLMGAMGDFTREIEAVADERNMLIHSSVTGFSEETTTRIELSNTTHKRGKFIQRRLSPSVFEIGSLAGSIDRLNTKLLFGFFINATRFQKNLERAGIAVPQAPPPSGPKPPNPK